LKGESEELRRLRVLWGEHTHSPAPGTGSDSRRQEVALRRGSLDSNLGKMLATRRAEGNERVFRAAGDLGEPVRSYVARLIAIEDLLAELPIE